MIGGDGLAMDDTVTSDDFSSYAVAVPEIASSPTTVILFDYETRRSSPVYGNRFTQI